MKNYVRDKRMALGMTQDELSEKLDVSRQTDPFHGCKTTLTGLAHEM